MCIDDEWKLKKNWKYSNFIIASKCVGRIVSIQHFTSFGLPNFIYKLIYVHFILHQERTTALIVTCTKLRCLRIQKIEKKRQIVMHSLPNMAGNDTIFSCCCCCWVFFFFLFFFHLTHFTETVEQHLFFKNNSDFVVVVVVCRCCCSLDVGTMMIRLKFINTKFHRNGFYFSTSRTTAFTCMCACVCVGQQRRRNM